jgi:ribosomal-protein-alanine N-acetyltransferase
MASPSNAKPRPCHRRQGLGLALLGLAMGLAREAGLSTCYLEVAESNMAARALYQRFGFETIAVRKDYYQTSRDAPETALVCKLEITQYAC